MIRTLTLAAALTATLAVPVLAQEPPRNPLAAPDPWAGVWTDGALRVTLERRASGYGGTIELQGQRYALAATGAAERLDGSFEVEGNRFALSLAREGDVVVLTTDGATYRLRREAPRNPLGGGPAPAQPGPSTQPAPATQPAPTEIPNDWQRWRHPLGNELRYPPQWQLQETQFGLSFVPPDMARDAYGQPQELILVQAVPAQGVTRPDDPKAVQFVESSMRTYFPFLRRTGEVVVRQTGGRPVAELTFSGTNQQGQACQALTLVTIIQDQCGLGHLVAAPERFAAREPVVRQIFASCGIGQAERDPRLIGTWTYESYTQSKDFSSTNVTNLTFAPDGGHRRGGQFAAGQTHRQDGEETGRSLVDSGGVNGEVGTWVAGNGKLTVRWQNGTFEEWTYEVNGPNLLLKGTGEPRLYVRSN